MSHTPGPWTCGSYSPIVALPIMAQPDKAKNPVLIASVCVTDDARLIAAAPELLEALKALSALADGGEVPAQVTVRRCEALIAKATGKEAL